MSYANGTQLKSSSAGAGNGAARPAPGRPQSYATIYSKDSSDRLLWEMRAANRTPNTTPVSTVLNSPDLTDLDTKMRYQHSTLMQHHQIKVGRSPVGSGGNNDSNSSTNPSSPTQPTGPNGSAGGGGGDGNHPGGGHLGGHGQPFSSFSLLSDGEMVVFDDIDSIGRRNWRMSGDRDILGSSPVPSENEEEEEDDSGGEGSGGGGKNADTGRRIC